MQELNREDIIAAARMMGLQYSGAEAELAQARVQQMRDTLAELRSSALFSLHDPPASRYHPHPAPVTDSAPPRTILFPPSAPGPSGTDDLVWASISDLRGWMDNGAVSAEEVLEAFEQRMERVNPTINAVVTRLGEHARSLLRALRARLPEPGPSAPVLSGIPWGAKDLLDTAGTLTTFGAEPYRNRVAESDAWVVSQLREAGALLLAKLSLGELAVNDVWFGGRTNNPWKPEVGSSGSSAGPASAVAAGAVPFALGSETAGSIISPSTRCGVVGLRPTFGRVPRTGAMPLSWSFDKLGPIARTPRDTGIVLSAIAGYDPGDPWGVPNTFPTTQDVAVLTSPEPRFRVGFHPDWFAEREDETDGFDPPTSLKRTVLGAVERMPGVSMREVSLPELPIRSLSLLLSADAAAVFEELTLSDRDDLLAVQSAEGWANTFRVARMLSAVDYVQLDRMRQKLVSAMAAMMEPVDCLIAPAYADGARLLFATTATGHPSLTFPIGLRKDGLPDSLTLWGKPWGEALLIRLAEEIQKDFSLGATRPLLDS